MRMRILFYAFLLFYTIANAGDPNPVKYLGIEHGLSNNAVTCIYQDHNGFMWFGTYDGLNRYDGYSFKVFRNVIGDSNSLNDNHIYNIDGDADHNIWIGGVKGISIYHPARSDFSTPRFIAWRTGIRQKTKEGVSVIKSMSNGMFILAGTQDHGLLVFEKDQSSGIQVPFNSFKGHEASYNVSAIE